MKAKDRQIAAEVCRDVGWNEAYGLANSQPLSGVKLCRIQLQSNCDYGFSVISRSNQDYQLLVLRNWHSLELCQLQLRSNHSYSYPAIFRSNRDYQFLILSNQNSTSLGQVDSWYFRQRPLKEPWKSVWNETICHGSCTLVSGRTYHTFFLRSFFFFLGCCGVVRLAGKVNYCNNLASKPTDWAEAAALRDVANVKMPVGKLLWDDSHKTIIGFLYENQETKIIPLSPCDISMTFLSPTIYSFSWVTFKGLCFSFWGFWHLDTFRGNSSTSLESNGQVLVSVSNVVIWRL